MQKTLHISVAIVTYNSSEHIQACLSSLLAACPDNVVMYPSVVDNASTDDTVAKIKLTHPEVRMHASQTNDGFAASTNWSLKAIGEDVSLCLILNPDTQLRAGVLESLIKVMRTRPDVGIVGCRLERANGDFDHASKRSFPRPAEAIKYFVQKQLRLPRTSAYLAHDVGEWDSGEVDAINGALMLVRRDAMREVGLFDPGYWMYAEDLDWCRRFHEAGWKVYYQGKVSALHLKGASAGKHRNLKVNWHFHYSMMRYYHIYDSGKRPVGDAFIYAGILTKFCFSAMWSAIRRATPFIGAGHP